jgi:hypothetical protein
MGLKGIEGVKGEVGKRQRVSIEGVCRRGESRVDRPDRCAVVACRAESE